MRCAIAALLCACAAPPGAGVDGGGDGPPGDGAPAAKLVAYVSGGGPDIAWFDVAADGTLRPVGRIASFAANPSFLAVDPGATTLYAVSSNANRVGAYAIDRATGALTFLNDVAAGGTGPTHLTVDRGGKYVLVASYG